MEPRKFKGLDVHHLAIFVAVYRLRSFSRASRSLGLSQPTITEHIKNMEIELDRQLFDRTGRKIFPTTDADRLHEQAVHVLDAMETLYDGISRDEEAITGKLRIGASTIPGTYLFPVTAASFKQEHPKVAFEIVIEDSGRICDRVLSHDLMMGAVGAVPDDDRLEALPLLRDRLVLTARPDLWQKESISLRELGHVSFIQREEGSGTRKAMENYLESRGIEAASLRVTATLGSTEAVRAALLAGLGFSIISDMAVGEDIRRKRLREISIKGGRLNRTFYLITHRKRTLPAPYRAFRDFLKDRNGTSK